MKPTFLLSQLVVLGASLLFGCLSIFAIVVGGVHSFLIPLYFWAPATLLMWGIATLLGPYDVFVIVTGTCAVAITFGLSYSIDVSIFLPDNGHAMHGGVLGAGAYPFDILGQAFILARSIVWVVTAVVVGIALKRGWGSIKSAAREPVKIIPVFAKRAWLTGEIAVIILATVWILFAKVAAQNRLGNPAFVAQLLQSPNMPAHERTEILLRHAMDNSEEWMDVFRRAVHEQPAPVNLTAATLLLSRGDITGLPLLEDKLWHSPHVIIPYGGGQGEWDTDITLENIHDPTALPVLLHLMTSPDPKTRRVVAGALSNIPSPSSTDALIKGLDDSDQEVRLSCVTALAKIAGDKYYLDQGPYPQNEKVYLDHWKAWGRQRNQAKP